MQIVGFTAGSVSLVMIMKAIRLLDIDIAIAKWC